ncbi:MAG: leucine-rich repeat domain-containing protein, partial [Muribaculaceae bacterium]|nr:leucine-rich repeat domain-containing protein [Muribaculaceae bacterium]
QEGIRSLESNAFAYCSSLESVKLPESVTSLGSDCFAFNSSLKSITISPKVEDVPFGFVYECDKLERLIIPEGVKTLGGEIVSGRSTALDFISLPSTLSSMSTSRYQSLKNLDRNVVIYSWALNPPYAPMEDFQELEVHVCEKALAAYKNDNVWSKAILVGDLTQEHTLVVDGIDVIITVPQNDINGQAKVSIYKVVVTPEYADGSHGESSEFIFDGKGNPIGGPEMQVKAKAPAGGTQLKIEGLDPDTKYQFELKGYTADRSLVYSGQYTVTTGISGVTDMEISESDAKFYNLYGVYLGNDVDALSPGLYIVVTDKGTFKWCK